MYCKSKVSKVSNFSPEMSLGSFFLILMANTATTAQALDSQTVLENVRKEQPDPHMPVVSWVICEAQWPAANIKVFISFLQFTIYSA